MNFLIRSVKLLQYFSDEKYLRNISIANAGTTCTMIGFECEARGQSFSYAYCQADYWLPPTIELDKPQPSLARSNSEERIIKDCALVALAFQIALPGKLSKETREASEQPFAAMARFG
jgi:hypothetical protein